MIQKPGAEVLIKQKLTFPDAKNGPGLRFISKAALVGNFSHSCPCWTCFGESGVVENQEYVTLEAFTSRKLRRV